MRTIRRAWIFLGYSFSWIMQLSNGMAGMVLWMSYYIIENRAGKLWNKAYYIYWVISNSRGDVHFNFISSIFYPVVDIACNERRSCEDPYNNVDLIQGTKEEIQNRCVKELECKAIEYNSKEQRGRLCRSTSYRYSELWQVCVITGICFIWRIQ